ncbi:hypothetical protein NDN08_001246 [Rhodosorus marinus]|uniref:Peptidase C14 caspase domain-containing protein n=1 Tax=Rhodosorus marinus TaxID=101924 RepID=A0AAV8UQE1_9RHOD|nr:hypothetical protein NDN08_001246 [Rhodosorus marinus]
MSKKAVLVGCNYPGSQAELAGCVNDAFMIKGFLTEYKGFSDDDITVLIDTDDSYTSPTGANIKSALTTMCSGSQPGDVLVFHFSGHGTQVASDGDDQEDDHKDEAICPTDMNLLVDDDLKAIVSQIADGVDFTFISDCCHSGSMLDHSAVQIDGPKAGGTGQHLPEPSSLISFLGGSRDIDPEEVGVKSRELKPDLVASILSQKLGRTVGTRDIRSSLGSIFGPEASQFLSILGIGGSGGTGGAMSSLVGALSGGGAPAEPPSSGGGGGFGSLLGQVASAVGGDSAPATQAAHTPTTSAPPKPDPLSPDKGILITGCQAHETSADVRPPGGDAFGALTHTLVTVLKENPDGSYIETVTKVRAAMVEKKFAQNPCLECSEINSEKAFIC